MNTSKESALQKELSRARSKTRILENLIQNGCDLRDCPFSVKMEIGWAAPKVEYEIAASFKTIGGGDVFVVYGNNISQITDAANFYSREKYKTNAQFVKNESQSHVGRFVDLNGFAGEVVGIYPYSALTFSHYIVSHGKGIWILGADELSDMQDFEIDFDLDEYGFNQESERDLSLNAN